MAAKSTAATFHHSLVVQRLSDYALLFKFRLSLTVVFSSVIAFIIASHQLNAANVFMMFLGGFLITGAANALNQVLEKDFDKLMKRTMNRPLAAGRMNVSEAILSAGLCGMGGISILWFFFSPPGALLGALSLIIYAFVYTPLKRFTPFAVLVGAIPGALPPLIGWVCATGTVSFEACVITSIQFLWQFPHFWAIAWVAHDDYKNAGFKLLPSAGGQDRYTALLSIFYIIILIAVSTIPVATGMTGYVSGAVIFLAGVWFLFQAFRLYQSCRMKAAKKLMLGSIIYLPVVLIALLAGAAL